MLAQIAVRVIQEVQRVQPDYFQLGFIICCLNNRCPAVKPVVLYVSSNGNNAWSGRLFFPNKAGTDGPFSTLVRARDEARKIKNAGPVTVRVRAGIYELPDTLKFSSEDSGTALAPIIYEAYPGENPILSGGRAVNYFEPYRGKILKADVGAHGFKGIYFRQLFFKGMRQSLARHPNFDPKNPYGGGWSYVDGEIVSMYTAISGRTSAL